MLKLRDVTLVCYEAKALGLVDRALRSVLEKVEFHDVIVWSPKPIDISGVTTRSIPVQTPKLHSAMTLWYDAPNVVSTSHMLNMEWDSGINSVEKWMPEFLDYDYIGAPWPWHPTHRVGNGGFSLRSLRLMEFLARNVPMFPVEEPDDDILCRKYHDALTALGFIWAPETLATCFSFERGKVQITFGWHGLYNFPYMLAPEELLLRSKLANDHVRQKSEWQEMMHNAMSMGL